MSIYATFHHSEPVTPTIQTFWFKPSQSVLYTAGQFTELYLPHNSPDDRGQKRWFTLSSAPGEPLLAITSKFTEPGSTFKQALRALTSGAAVQLAEPMGDFVLPKDKTKPLVFVAAGVGITPVYSMAKHLQRTSQKRDITVLYGARYEQELAFRDFFTTAPLTFLPIVSRPAEAWDGASGQLTVERITAAALPHAAIYISGPEKLVEKIVRELTAAGVSKQRLITDYFHGYET